MTPPCLALAGALCLAPAALQAITLPFPGGTVVDETDDLGKPTGRELHWSDVITPKRTIRIDKGASATLKIPFRTQRIALYDAGNDSEESVHVEINGTRIEASYILRVFDGAGKKKLAGTGTLDTDPGQTTGTDRSERDYVDGKEDLFGGTSLDVTGYSLFLLNTGATRMDITSLRLGVDADFVSVIDPDPSPPKIPLPAPAALLATALAGLALRRPDPERGRLTPPAAAPGRSSRRTGSRPAARTSARRSSSPAAPAGS